MAETGSAASLELNEKLFKAAKAGDLDAVNECIAAGADVSYQADEGVSSLMTAAEEGHAEVVATLLQAGAPWNQQVGYCTIQYESSMPGATSLGAISLANRQVKYTYSQSGGSQAGRQQYYLV